MSPEQLAPDASGIDQRSDVYALGIVLYELLTGELPESCRGYRSQVSGATASTPSPSRHRASLTGDQLQTVAQRQGMPPGRLLGLLRRELDWVVVRATETDRDRRYASVAALVEDLHRFLQNQALAAAPGGRG